MIVPDDPTPDPYPDPAIRLRPQPTGTTLVTLADGNKWLMADGGLGNVLDEARDRLFAGSQLDGKVAMGDVFSAAGEMLLANYNLSGPEVIGLVMGLGLDEGSRQPLHDGLVKAVMGAMFGAAGEKGYTEWALASLLANGIRPEDVPTPILRSVLAILALTKRTVPVDEFVSSIAKSNAFNELRALARPLS